jgi:hypothetical protein
LCHDIAGSGKPDVRQPAGPAIAARRTNAKRRMKKTTIPQPIMKRTGAAIRKLSAPNDMRPMRILAALTPSYRCHPGTVAPG